MQLLETFELGGSPVAEKDKVVRELFNGSRRRIIEIKLINNAVLTRHKAAEPITVLCLAGNGLFRAGVDLDDELPLRPGTFLTLEADVDHEAVAEPSLHLLVTRFTQT